MLSAIGQRELPIPEHIDIFHLTEEYPATDKSALEAVIEVRIRLHCLPHCQCDCMQLHLFVSCNTARDKPERHFVQEIIEFVYFNFLLPNGP